MTTTTAERPQKASRRRGARSEATPVVAAQRSRRRPRLFLIGLALAALGGIATWTFMQGLNQNVTVLAAGQTIHRGEVIESADLVTLEVSADNASRFFDAARQAEVVGQPAAVEILTGTAFTSEHLGGPTAPNGEAIVGVSLTQAQMPSIELRPGDAVAIVQTLTPGAVAPEGFVPTRFDATVFSVTQDGATGTWIVNALVDDEGDAVNVASLAASGSVALVLLDQVSAGE